MARLLAVAGFLVTIGAVAYTRWSTSVVSMPTFQEVRPSLYRLNYDWNMMPPFPPVPVAIWLIESSTLLSPKSWILVDAGTDDSTSQEAILLGVKSKLSSAGGSLKVIMLTHGHKDHTGALTKLLKAYPDAKVAYHEDEEPFISGGAQYSDLEGDHWVFNLARKALPPSHFATNTSLLPAKEAIKLQGSSGDVSTYISWLSKGFLEYIAVPGHTPGMVALYHKPTKSVIAGDSFMHISAWFPFSKTLNVKPSNPAGPVTTNMKQTKESQQKLAGISDATTYFSSHDSHVGLSADSFRNIAAS